MSAHEPLYRVALVNISPVAHGTRFRVQALGSEKTLELGGDEVGILLFCTTFQTIQRHIEIYRNRYNPDSDIIPRLKKILEESVLACFLIEEMELATQLTESAQKSVLAEDFIEKKIDLIGIPTRNRPGELRSCMKSYVENAIRYGRTPEVVIADDSNGAFLEQNINTIEELRQKYAVTITHLDIQCRTEHARELAHKKGIDPEVMNFIICGDASDQNHVGALRNALLLYAAGRKILMVDDDTMCNIHSLLGNEPSRDINSLTVTSAAPRPSWFFDSYESALAYFPQHDIDYLGEHEKLLGRSVTSLTSGSTPPTIHFNHELYGISSTLLYDIQQGSLSQQRIAVTFPGGVGHSWMRMHPPTLIEQTEHPHNLWGTSTEEYKANRLSSHIARIPEKYTVYKGPEYFGLNIAIDTSRPLPLFPPRGVNEDGNFGFLMNAYFPRALSGFIPYAVEHRRTTPHVPVTNTLHGLRSPWMLTIVLMEMIHRYQMRHTNQPKLTDLSKELHILASLPIYAFKQTVLTEVSEKITSSLEYYRQLKAHYAHGPQYWHIEIDELIQKYEDILKSDLSLFIPFFQDMKKVSGETFGWKEFQMWLRKWGGVMVENEKFVLERNIQ